MNPTNKLRFVERKVPLHPFYRTVDPDGKPREGVQTYRVLQQWWEDNRHDIHWVDGAPGEWRDVPLEVET